jgi:hypothetical protein
MRGIYEVRCWDGLRCHNIHTKYHKAWFSHSKVDGGGGDTQRHRQHCDRISLLSFFQNKESRLKDKHSETFLHHESHMHFGGNKSTIQELLYLGQYCVFRWLQSEVINTAPPTYRPISRKDEQETAQDDEMAQASDLCSK